MRSDAFESSSDDLCLEGCPPARDRDRAPPFNDDPRRADDGVGGMDGKESLLPIPPLFVVAFAVVRRRVAGIVRRQAGDARARTDGPRTRCDANGNSRREGNSRRDVKRAVENGCTKRIKTYARVCSFVRLSRRSSRARGAASARRTLASTCSRVGADETIFPCVKKASTSKTLFRDQSAIFIFSDNVA